LWWLAALWGACTRGLSSGRHSKVDLVGTEVYTLIIRFLPHPSTPVLREREGEKDRFIDG